MLIVNETEVSCNNLWMVQNGLKDLLITGVEGWQVAL